MIERCSKGNTKNKGKLSNLQLYSRWRKVSREMNLKTNLFSQQVHILLRKIYKALETLENVSATTERVIDDTYDEINEGVLKWLALSGLRSENVTVSGVLIK